MFNYKVFVAELIGTFALVFVGAAVGLYNAGLLAVALAYGFTYAVFIYTFGHISGSHINPAVTFGHALNGTVAWADALVYWVAQLVGAILAAYTLKAAVGVVSPEAFAAAQSTGVLTEQFPYYAVAIEALLTFFLLNTILHTDVAGRRGPMTGWAIGTTLAIGILAGGPLTGAAMNPARAFGPAVVAGAAGNGMMYLIYFVGPFLGAAMAVGIYRLLNTPAASPDLESDVEEASDGEDDDLDQQESE